MKTLKEIFSSPSRKDKTIGVIVDISGAQKVGQNEELDFQTKIKVLTYINRLQTKLITLPKKYSPAPNPICTSLFTAKPLKMPHKSKIQGILFTSKDSRFFYFTQFSKFESGNQVYLSATTIGHFSHWRIYSGCIIIKKGLETDNLNNNFTSYQKNVRDDADSERSSEKLVSLITELRIFNKQFF